MTPERWQRLSSIYHAAYACPTDERVALVRDLCAGDDVLRQEVEDLLAQGAIEGGVLSRSPLDGLSGSAEVDAEPRLTGRQVGTYTVKELLGKGGMGEVYRAHDAQLGRDVALKILPPAFTNDPERLARFEREARILASLNHPNVAAIYGLERRDGMHALVLELVEGPTLAERITSGRMTVSEALDAARQIAEALDSAHQRGIVHRDLKPANVKLTSAGMVKVLDFGLAKTIVAADALATRSKTTTGETRAGTLLGTVPYMSPEQARGQAVDKRADIWAFGCVLYEMLTGRAAFAGDSAADVLAAVVEKTPDWSALPASLPPAVTRLLQRCLEKDVRRRLRDVGEASLVLEDALSAPPAAVAVPNQRTRNWRVIAGLVSAGAVALFSLVWWIGRGSQTAPPAASELGAVTQVTFDPGLSTDPSLSADGRFLAYASSRSKSGNLDLYVQQIGGGPAIRLTDDPADDRQPDLSPDGSLVAFRSERNPFGIYVVPTLGGSARLIAPGGQRPRFSPDGRSIAFEFGGVEGPVAVGSDRQVFVIPTIGGTPARLAADLVFAGAPVWSTDGRSLLVLGRLANSGADAALDWWRVDTKTEAKATRTGTFDLLGRHGFRLALDAVTVPYPRAWSEEGIFFSATTGSGDSLDIWRLTAEASTARPTGAPQRLTSGTTLNSEAAISRDGRLVWASRTSIQTQFGLPLAADTGKAQGVLSKLHDHTTPTGASAITEDGRLLIFPRYETSSGGLWGLDLTTRREWQLVATPRAPLNPVVSPDGLWVGYTVTAAQEGTLGGPGDVYVIETTGRTPRKLCEQCQAAGWTRRDQLVVRSADGRSLIRVDPVTGTQTPLIERAAAVVSRPYFGPGDAWMIVTVPSAIAPRIVRVPVHDGRATLESEWTTVLQGRGAGPDSIVPGLDRQAGMSPDGRLLYVLSFSDGFRCLYALPLDASGLATAEPFPVAHFHDSTLRWGSTSAGNAVGKGLFVADLFETRGNIWMSQLGPPDPRTASGP